MSTNIKGEALRLLKDLPDDVTWDDLMHEIYMLAELDHRLTAQTQSSSTGISWDELKEKIQKQP